MKVVLVILLVFGGCVVVGQEKTLELSFEQLEINATVLDGNWQLVTETDEAMLFLNKKSLVRSRNTVKAWTKDIAKPGHAGMDSNTVHIFKRPRAAYPWIRKLPLFSLSIGV